MTLHRKPYIVNVPVKITIWTRCNLASRLFDVIKEVRPSILFVCSDGGRNEEEWTAIAENRKLFDKYIDWDCTVHLLYENVNIGSEVMVQKNLSYIWSKVDRCIFLNDNHLPTAEYFSFCAELLNKYLYDQRIERICGHNPLGIWNNCPYDYFFSRIGSPIGIATWKDRVENRDWNHNIGNDNYTLSLIKRQCELYGSSFWKIVGEYSQKSKYEKQTANSGYYSLLEAYSNHRLCIIPTKNMISNLDNNGCIVGPETIHEPINQIKHPICTIPDENFVNAADMHTLFTNTTNSQTKTTIRTNYISQTNIL